MRLPISLTVLPILAVLIVGLRNQRRIEELKNPHNLEETAANPRKHHPVADAAPAGEGGGRHADPRRAHDRRELDAVLDYARSLPFPDNLSAHERLRRVAMETERIQQMDRQQLNTLIGILSQSQEIAAPVRQSLLTFILPELARTHPREAFEHVARLREDLPLRSLLPEMLQLWGRTEPVTGRAWLDDLPAWVPEDQTAELEWSFLEGAVAADPALALEWIANRKKLADWIRWLQWGTKHLPEAAAENWRAAMLAHPITSAPLKRATITSAPDSHSPEVPQSPVAPANAAESPIAVAKAVPGKPGLVFSPFTNSVVDVAGLPSGTLVRDPTLPEGGVFRVP